MNTSETQKIQGTAGSYHGSAVALSDDASTLVAGAVGENPAGGAPDDTGAAHVFVRNNPGFAASYLAAARLTPSDGAPSDIFAWTITMNGTGTTIVVGAPGDSADTFRPHGAAYVLRETPCRLGKPGSESHRDGQTDDERWQWRRFTGYVGGHQSRRQHDCGRNVQGAKQSVGSTNRPCTSSRSPRRGGRMPPRTPRSFRRGRLMTGSAGRRA